MYTDSYRAGRSKSASGPNEPKKRCRLTRRHCSTSAPRSSAEWVRVAHQALSTRAPPAKLPTEARPTAAAPPRVRLRHHATTWQPLTPCKAAMRTVLDTPDQHGPLNDKAPQAHCIRPLFQNSTLRAELPPRAEDVQTPSPPQPFLQSTRTRQHDRVQCQVHGRARSACARRCPSRPGRLWCAHPSPLSPGSPAARPGQTRDTEHSTDTVPILRSDPVPADHRPRVRKGPPRERRVGWIAVTSGDRPAARLQQAGST